MKHKLKDMINIKRGHKLCLDCRESYKKIVKVSM